MFDYKTRPDIKGVFSDALVCCFFFFVYFIPGRFHVVVPDDITYFAL